jgi:V/A-type H+-transporting ATPase subunit A
MNENVSDEWVPLRTKAMTLLQEEANLQEIVRLVGIDALSEGDRLKLEVAKSIREDYLMQNAFHDVDTYASLAKQFKMLKLVLAFQDHAERALKAGVYLNKIVDMQEMRDKIARAKYIPETDIDRIDAIRDELEKAIDKLIAEEGVMVNA